MCSHTRSGTAEEEGALPPFPAQWAATVETWWSGEVGITVRAVLGMDETDRDLFGAALVHLMRERGPCPRADEIIREIRKQELWNR